MKREIESVAGALSQSEEVNLVLKTRAKVSVAGSVGRADQRVVFVPSENSIDTRVRKGGVPQTKGVAKIGIGVDTTRTKRRPFIRVRYGEKGPNVSSSKRKGARIFTHLREAAELARNCPWQAEQSDSLVQCLRL